MMATLLPLHVSTLSACLKKAEMFDEEGNLIFKKLSEIYYDKFFK